MTYTCDGGHIFKETDGCGDDNALDNQYDVDECCNDDDDDDDDEDDDHGPNDDDSDEILTKYGYTSKETLPLDTASCPRCFLMMVMMVMMH